MTFKNISHHCISIVGLTFLSTSLVSSCGGFGPGGNQDQPNILFILVDDLGFSDVGYMGLKPGVQTPYIDRLASEGMVFTSAYAACPVCSPTRASVITGKYPAALRLTNHIPGIGMQTYKDRVNQGCKLLDAEYVDHMLPDNLFIAELLKDKGYATAYIGKWHLSGEGSGRVPVGVVNPIWQPENYGFDLNIAGTSQGQPPSYFSPYGIATIIDGPEGEYLTDRLGDEVVAYLHKNRNEPFFLFWAPYSVHTPYQVSQKYIDLYGGDKYLAMIHKLDENVGKVMDALRESELEDNTLVIFYSDNGGLQPNPPLNSIKASLAEGGIRVPLVVRWPGKVPAGTYNEEIITSVDMLPTLAEAAGYDPSTLDEIHGLSFFSILRGENHELPERAIFWHFPHNRRLAFDMGSAIREGRWKLIWSFENDDLFLFDLENDIAESTNLLEEYPDKATGLLNKLMAWQLSVGAVMPQPNPDYPAQ